MRILSTCLRDSKEKNLKHDEEIRKVKKEKASLVDRLGTLRNQVSYTSNYLWIPRSATLFAVHILPGTSTMRKLIMHNKKNKFSSKSYIVNIFVYFKNTASQLNQTGAKIICDIK